MFINSILQGLFMKDKTNPTPKKIAEYINECYFSQGYTPTLREIAKKMNLSLSTVHGYISRMEKNGLIECGTTDSGKNHRLARGVKTAAINKSASQTSLAPLVGTVACGTPVLAEENIECYIPLPEELTGKGEFFVLRTQGYSMKNAGILPGDLVVIRKQNVAENGQIVVALVDGESATLKRYFKDGGNSPVRLHPENETMEDILSFNVEIQGIAIKIIKDVV
mgnify:CR=1 FL=1